MVKRNTRQKRLILDIHRTLNHPSATMVFEAVHDADPTVSRATVFRVLSEAAEEGRLQRLKISGADDRFDITVRPHSHILCRRCGEVDDVEIQQTGHDTIASANAHGYIIEDCEISFTGLCPRCAAAEESKCAGA